MQEIQNTPRETPGGAGLGNLFDDSSDPAGLVTVAVGPYVERLPVGRSTVGEIRNRFRSRFDIDPRSQAVLDGNEVTDDTVVRTGQVLMFIHKSGEKGGPRSGRQRGPGGHRGGTRLQRTGGRLRSLQCVETIGPRARASSRCDIAPPDPRAAGHSDDLGWDRP